MKTPVLDRPMILGFIGDLEKIVEAALRGDLENIEECATSLTEDIKAVLPPETVADIQDIHPDDLSGLAGVLAGHVDSPEDIKYVILEPRIKADDQAATLVRVFDRTEKTTKDLFSSVIVPVEARLFDLDPWPPVPSVQPEIMKSASAPVKLINSGAGFATLAARSIVEAQGSQGRLVALCTRKGRFLVSGAEEVMSAKAAWSMVEDIGASDVVVVRG